MQIKYAGGWLAILVLFVLLVPFPTRADRELLKWGEIGKPGLSGNIVVGSSEVTQIAVGRGGTIYAINSENTTVYKSVNSGSTWENIATHLIEAGATLPASQVATAPDSSDVVAVVTNSGSRVFVSTNGGVTWTNTNLPTLTGAIQALAISKQYTEGDDSVRDVAIGMAVWGDNTTTGQLWVFQLGKFVVSWRNQSLTVDPAKVGGEVSALAFSPGYQRDDTLIVVASTGNDTASGYRNKTWLCLGKRNTAAGTTAWGTFSGYPVEIAATSAPSAGDAAGASVSSSLALPSNYSGSQDTSRVLFVSYNRTPDASDDVYRFSDTAGFRLNASGTTPPTNINISSLAYSGSISSGKLLAGDVSQVAGSPTVQVRRTSNPFDTEVTWYRASLPPTGPGNARVSWSSNGTTAYCGTGQSPAAALDESAFSMSSDDGDNWQQLSLIDTTLTLSDLTPAADSKTLFVATYSQFGPEGVWRTTTTEAGLGWYWSRQLTMDTTSNSSRVILRSSPDYAKDFTIFAAEVGGNMMAVTHNRGNSWKLREAPGAVVDMVVGDADTVYLALPGGYIRKSINNVWSWTEAVSTGLPDINGLALAGKGTILVGGRSGDVAYSTDGGVTFTKINKTIGSGDVQVVADADYVKNGIIYAATSAPDGGIWRWTIGQSTLWEQIDESITALNTGQRVSGLRIGGRGALYALRREAVNGGSGGVSRSLNPAETAPARIEFEGANSGLPVSAAFDPTAVYSHTLPYLKLSGGAGQDDLWSIDTATQTIYQFQDSLSQIAPTLREPANGAVIPVNTRDGGIYPAFGWEEQPGVTQYEVAVYLDPKATQIVWSGTSTTEALAVTSGNKLPQTSPGTIYYWRVRASEPVKSLWSETRSMAGELANAWSPLVLSTPAPGARDVAIRPTFAWNSVDGAKGYELTLARDSGFNDVVAAMTGKNALTRTFWVCDRDLDFAATYYWQVRATGVNSRSQWVTGAFTTAEKPAVESPSVVVQPAPTSSVPSPPPAPSMTAETLVPVSILWVAIGIGGALVIVVLGLIVIRGR